VPPRGEGAGRAPVKRKALVHAVDSVRLTAELNGMALKG